MIHETNSVLGEASNRPTDKPERPLRGKSGRDKEARTGSKSSIPTTPFANVEDLENLDPNALGTSSENMGWRGKSKAEFWEVTLEGLGKRLDEVKRQGKGPRAGPSNGMSMLFC